jgi:uncharacterized protein (TIGR01777 family)
MKVLLAGGTGFLGSPLRAALAAHGHEVVVLTRGVPRTDVTGRLVHWDAETASGPWTAELDSTDVVISLAGAGLADRRWTRRRKEVLRRSRIDSTRTLVKAMRNAGQPPGSFISGSAVGVYGDTGDRTVDERSPAGTDFLARLCVEWEHEARAAESLGCRLVILRTGVVLAPDGGALEKLVAPFRFFVGGPISSGRQYVSWIHRTDWLRLTLWAAEHPEMSGVFNATTPRPVTNAELAAAIGRALHRPSWLTVPRPPLRILFGELADVALVKGQRVMPSRALEAGFTFEYADIDAALGSMLEHT